MVHAPPSRVGNAKTPETHSSALKMPEFLKKKAQALETDRSEILIGPSSRRL